MNDRDPRSELSTEERLRRAVRSRDAQVNTSPDALPQILGRVGEQRRRRIRSRPGLVTAAAAAVLIVVVGLVLTLRDSGESPDVATEDPSPASVADDDAARDPEAEAEGDEPAAAPTSTSSTPPAATTPEPTASPPLPELSPGQRAAQGLVVWPLDSRSFEDATSVVFSYATQALGIESPVIEVECCDGDLAAATIAQRREDGSAFGEATRLELVALDDFNWVVVSASSEELTIRGIAGAGEGLASVHGSGRSFEGAAQLVVRSVCDPDGVATSVAVGGGPDFADFAEIVEFVPCGDNPLVFELATDTIATTEVPFVTAVSDRVSPFEPIWAVMAVAPDDRLNVRSEAGVGNPLVGSLAPDENGVTVTGESADVDGSTWVEVRLPDRSTGWVNDAYLTAQPPVFGALQAELLVAAAESLITGIDVEVSPRGLYVGGIGVFADAPSPFRRVDPSAFADDRILDWDPFPEDSPCGTECDLSVADFLDLGAVADRFSPEVVVDGLGDLSPEDQFHLGPMDQLARFGTLHAVTFEVPPTTEGDLDWRRYHVWLDWESGVPRAVAVWRWGWTP